MSGLYQRALAIRRERDLPQPVRNEKLPSAGKPSISSEKREKIFAGTGGISVEGGIKTVRAGFFSMLTSRGVILPLLLTGLASLIILLGVLVVPYRIIQKLESEIRRAERELAQYNNRAAPNAAAGPIDLLKTGLAVDPQTAATKYLDLLSLEQKIGQRFITWIDGTEVTDRMKRLIQEGYVGGIIIYPWNIENKEQIKRLTFDLQQISLMNNPPISLFLSVDQEGGRVNTIRLPENAQFPAAYYWGRHNDLHFVSAAAYITAREISELGFNMNFAPVLDLYDKPDRTIIGDRSMGSDPAAIGELGISYLQGAARAGIIPVIKHFPGHGSTTVDSHGSLPIVDSKKNLLMERDFKPFEMAINHGAEALMTAHILFTEIDPEYPVTLSHRILTGILRGHYGFQGVVIADGMAMGALSDNYSVTETLRLFFKAGVDLILIHSSYDLLELKKEVYRLYKEGQITEKEIDAGVERILRLKAKYALLPGDF